jgi:hypothetical protein
MTPSDSAESQTHTLSLRTGQQDCVFATAAARIKSRRDDVFAFVCDAQNDPQWNPKVVEVAKLTAGPIGVGTTFRYVMAYFAGSIESEWRITAYDPGRLLHGKSVDGPFAFEGGYEFEPQDGATCITRYASLDLAGILPPFIPAALARKLLVKEFETAFVRLQRIFGCES